MPAVLRPTNPDAIDIYEWELLSDQPYDPALANLGYVTPPRYPGFLGVHSDYTPPPPLAAFAEPGWPDLVRAWGSPSLDPPGFAAGSNGNSSIQPQPTAVYPQYTPLPIPYPDGRQILEPPPFQSQYTPLPALFPEGRRIVEPDFDEMGPEEMLAYLRSEFDTAGPIADLERFSREAVTYLGQMFIIDPIAGVIALPSNIANGRWGEAAMGLIDLAGMVAPPLRALGIGARSADELGAAIATTDNIAPASDEIVDLMPRDFNVFDIEMTGQPFYRHFEPDEIGLDGTYVYDTDGKSIFIDAGGQAANPHVIGPANINLPYQSITLEQVNRILRQIMPVRPDGTVPQGYEIVPLQEMYDTVFRETGRLRHNYDPAGQVIHNGTEVRYVQIADDLDPAVTPRVVLHEALGHAFDRTAGGFSWSDPEVGNELLWAFHNQSTNHNPRTWNTAGDHAPPDAYTPRTRSPSISDEQFRAELVAEGLRFLATNPLAAYTHTPRMVAWFRDAIRRSPALSPYFRVASAETWWEQEDDLMGFA